MAESLRKKYKGAFFSGLAALLPTLLTIFVISVCWNFLSEKIATPITRGIEWGLSRDVAKEWYWGKLLNTPEWRLDDSEDDRALARANGLREDVPFEVMVDRHVPQWLGIVIAIFLVLGVGLLFKGYVGRQVWRVLEGVLLRVPLLKVIYPYAKQVTEFFFAEKKQIQYESVVALQYPRMGLWSIGFVTSEGFRQVCEASGEEVVSIFIPSSPTPVTGYTIIIPRKDIIRLDIGVDEALRFTISGGVIVPPTQATPVSLKTRKLDRPSRPTARGGAPSDGERTPEGNVENASSS